MATLVKGSILKVIGINHSGKVAACVFIQNRGIAGKALRATLPPPALKKPPPFDYVNKDYTVFHSIFDRTTYRFDQNTKVVVVEGPIASGKSKFAAELAEDLDMKHFPEANMDIHYVRDNGIDLRQFDPEVPEYTRTFDHKNFCLTPNHRLAGNFQIMMYIARFNQYIDALAHVLNTGQGVVLERSPYSDFVFLEAMFSQKYISKGVRSVYFDLQQATIEELMRPHLVIYLDVPAAKVKEQINSRNLDYETKGKALTSEYLQEIERQYKNDYLKNISKHAELLIYDWTGGGDVEVVVEDIERLEFDKYTERTEPKMKDWRFPRQFEWANKRMLYTNHKNYLMNLFNMPRYDVPELIMGAEDHYERNKVIYSHPKFEYLTGYNTVDSNLLLKNKTPKYGENV